MSDYLTIRELKGLNRLGNVLIPGSPDYPSFSETGCIHHVDLLMESTPAADVRDFKLLMSVMSMLPEGGIRFLLNLVEKEARFPAPIGGLLRLLSLGMKGVVFSLYYSNKTGEFYRGKKVHDVMDYQVHCEPLD